MKKFKIREIEPKIWISEENSTDKYELEFCSWFSILFLRRALEEVVKPTINVL